MQSAFFGAICRVGIFVICAQTITHFRPKSSYEKYLKLLVSVMILVQIVQPVTALFGGEGETDLESRVWQIWEEVKKSADASAESAARSEQILEQMTLAEVERLLSESRAAEEKQAEEEPTKEGQTKRKQAEEGPTESGSGAMEKIERVERVAIGQKEGGSGDEGQVEAVDQ